MLRNHPALAPMLALCLALLAPRTVRAHFFLHSPGNWRDQDFLGSPQKQGPCGDEGTAAATGVVTSFAPGDTVTITLDETIFHPGHYRVALAVNDRSELPAEPPVTPGGTPCGSVPIMTVPVFPVLADGALEHTSALSGTQSIQVTLPSDVTCTHCTLQVLEFMSNHGAPCFYHHCADLSIQAPVGNACAVDADCEDHNACTSDHCNPAGFACENLPIAPSACDDGDTCTRDTCVAAQGCVAQPITLADVGVGFLGALPGAPCATDSIPPAIAARFQEADTLVVRAAQKPAKRAHLLKLALKRLHAAARKATRASGHGVSPACATALGTVLDQAQTSVRCLQGGPQ